MICNPKHYQKKEGIFDLLSEASSGAWKSLGWWTWYFFKSE